MTRAPGDLTPPDNPHDRAWAARDIARRIVRETIQDRARTDPGPSGDWCREIIEEETQRRVMALRDVGHAYGSALGLVVKTYRALWQGIAEGMRDSIPAIEEGQNDDRA